MKNGTRMSAAKAYIHPVRNRANLHILKSATVIKVIMDEQTVTAKGVDILVRGQKIRVMARKEVILSAGAINTPQLLMLSGIGPKDHLEKLGIKCLANLPVGHNLMDHVALGGLTFLSNTNFSISTEDVLSDPQNLYEFLVHRRGVITIPGGTEALAFIDLNRPSDPDGYPDLELMLISGTLSSDDTLRKNFNIKKTVYNSMYKPLKNRGGFMIFPMVLRPKSKGRVYLKSDNPLTPPVIDMGYFQHERDLDILVKGVRLAMKTIKTQAFEKLAPKMYDVPVPGCKHLKFDSDDYWKCHARHLSFTIYHQSGTCRMGPASDPTAVVDPRLRVHKVSRLRVIDASIFPEIPASHPNIIVIMIGEKASDMVKHDWNEAK